MGYGVGREGLNDRMPFEPRVEGSESMSEGEYARQRGQKV